MQKISNPDGSDKFCEIYWWTTLRHFPPKHYNVGLKTTLKSLFFSFLFKRQFFWTCHKIRVYWILTSFLFQFYFFRFSYCYMYKEVCFLKLIIEILTFYKCLYLVRILLVYTYRLLSSLRTLLNRGLLSNLSNIDKVFLWKQLHAPVIHLLWRHGVGWPVRGISPSVGGWIV